jgi:hypothetical protein
MELPYKELKEDQLSTSLPKKSHLLQQPLQKKFHWLQISSRFQSRRLKRRKSLGIYSPVHLIVFKPHQESCQELKKKAQGKNQLLNLFQMMLGRNNNLRWL